MRDGVDETLSYMAFPREHWTRIRTNNVLERIMREIRRRTRVVGNFPDGQSAVMLVAARLRHIAGTRWGKRIYLDMERLREMKQTDGRSSDRVNWAIFVPPRGNKGRRKPRGNSPVPGTTQNQCAHLDGHYQLPPSMPGRYFRSSASKRLQSLGTDQGSALPDDGRRQKAVLGTCTQS